MDYNSNGNEEDEYTKLFGAIFVALIITAVILIIIFISVKTSKEGFSMDDRKPIYITEDYSTTVDEVMCRSNPEFCTKDDMPARGINDMEQTTVTRGYVPTANQPDHVANLWKCDQSHCDTPNQYNDELQDQVADVYIPSRTKVVNLHLKDASDMHVTSRFSSVAS